MLEYLLKSAACMATFLLFYQFLLEKESMHHFKRFFLLGALMASLVIPTLVFTEYVEADTPALAPMIGSYESQEVLPASEPVSDMDVINWSLLLWTIYCLGAIIFGIRFIKHLYQILQRIRKNPKLKLQAITQVLLKEKMPPHTFFSYIFLNKEALEKKAIPKEVLIHEETHAKQFHSLDVLFIELLQVILWFNPLLLSFKKNIKLNHEFLADGAVLKDNVPTKSYQNTLLSFLSTTSERKYQSVKMANAINYSSIKKRFKVMKKRTSKKTVFIKTFLLLPLLLLLVSAFCEKKTVYTHQNQSKINGIWLNQPMEQYAFSIASDGETLKLYDGYSEIPVVHINNRYYAQYPTFSHEMVFDQKQGLLKFRGKEFIRFEDSYRKKYEGQWENGDASIKLTIENYNSAFICNLTINGKTNSFYPAGAGSKGFGFSYGQEHWSFELKDNGTLHDSKGNIYTKKQRPITSNGKNNSSLKGLTEKELLEYEGLAKRYESAKSGANRVSLSDIERMLELLNRMSERQKQNAKSVYTPLTRLNQTSASREQMKQYNALAKKYNAMPPNDMYIKMREVKLMKYIYNLMSDKQRADAEPFPEFPEPPAPPEPAVVEEFHSAVATSPGTNETNQVRNVPPPPNSPIVEEINGVTPEFEPPPHATMEEVRASPPPPPTPPTPLDHVIEMAKKGATFYYEGKKIAADKAIELFKKNKNLNIETTKTNSSRPQVKISKAPITIGKSDNTPTIETGNTTVNGKELFYTKKDGIISYHNKKGELVDQQGKKIGQVPKRTPTYYFNGEQISSVRAHELLRNNTSIQVTTEDITAEEYAIVLKDLNADTGHDYNKNTNHNALIDLTQMISKGASFFYNDKPITTEKALWLTQNEQIERVQTVGGKNGTPLVYFWKKV